MVIIIINHITLFCASLSTLVGFSDPWSGHSSVIPWIGAWASRGCCHGNCQGNKRKGRGDCLDWKVLDGKVGFTLQSAFMWHTEAWANPKCRKISGLIVQSDLFVFHLLTVSREAELLHCGLQVQLDRCESAKTVCWWTDLQWWLWFLDIFPAFLRNSFFQLHSEGVSWVFWWIRIHVSVILAVIVLYRCPIFDSPIEQIVSLM